MFLLIDSNFDKIEYVKNWFEAKKKAESQNLNIKEKVNGKFKYVWLNPWENVWQPKIAESKIKYFLSEV